MPTSVYIPKNVIEDVLEAGRRFVVAEETLEDFLLAADANFIKRMRRLRGEHQHGKIGDWQQLKARYGV